ncbi:MAG TPA: hypothetical protein VK034_07675 [Enhygromyxa sp.]|nr:hypothetical protein [Enhygromyxa sp.]
MRRAISTLAATALLMACGGGSHRNDGAGDGIDSGIDSGNDGSTGEDTNPTGNDGPLLDFGNDDGATTGNEDEGGDECAGTMPNPDAVLEGKVYAPNMVLPISGALVYMTDEAIEPVPDGVYCAECVELACDTPFTFTEPDGSFSLPAVSGPGQKLVVQKGQFLRVTDFNVAPGTNVVQPAQSNLPGLWNPAAGMWIPRIAVYATNPDKVFNVLAKFGLGQVDAAGALVPGTEQFDLIADSDQGAFLDNLAQMNQYHIIFVPCASTKYWVNAPNVPQARAENIRAYVEAGGKWYATDHSNEYIEQPFPNYQEFHNPGMPDIQPAYSSNGTVVDQDLLAWLQALPPSLKDIGGGNPNLLGLPSITTVLNYSGIDATYEIIVQNEDGEDVNVGHHTWVEGPCPSCSNPNQIRPMAISGQYGCGRMMYSTFENSSTNHQGLNPQELVLLYMILEIGVCFGDPPPPPPPIE